MYVWSRNNTGLKYISRLTLWLMGCLAQSSTWKEVVNSVVFLNRRWVNLWVIADEYTISIFSREGGIFQTYGRLIRRQSISFFALITVHKLSFPQQRRSEVEIQWRDSQMQRWPHPSWGNETQEQKMRPTSVEESGASHTATITLESRKVRAVCTMISVHLYKVCLSICPSVCLCPLPFNLKLTKSTENGDILWPCTDPIHILICSPDTAPPGDRQV